MAEQTATQVLDRHFLEIRCRLLDLAAVLDRIERSSGAESALADARMREIRGGLEILQSRGTDRAERIQLAFSDAYVEGWNR